MPPSRFRLQAQAVRPPQPAADLRQAGVTRSMTAGRHWRRTSFGHYLPTEQPSTTAQRLLDASVCLPSGGALGGWAAAFLCGVDWLDGFALDGVTLLPVPLCVGPEVHRRSTATLRYSRDRLPSSEVLRRQPLPVTSPLRTAFDAARWASSTVESVVVLDALAHFGLIQLGAMGAYVAAHAGWPGVRQVRSALPLAHRGVRSSWESRLRMVYVLEAGLPQPLVNPAVFDVYGNFVATPDLHDAEAGLAPEYDGSGHRARSQHNHDNAREEALENLGLIVIRVDSHEYRHQHHRLVERVVTARRRGLLRDRRRDHWALGRRDSEQLQVLAAQKCASPRYRRPSSSRG